MSDCSNIKADWARLEALAAVFTSPRSFAYHVGKDLIINGKDIYHEISDAIVQYDNQQWEQFGIDVGTAAAKTILGMDEPVETNQDELFLF